MSEDTDYLKKLHAFASALDSEKGFRELNADIHVNAPVCPPGHARELMSLTHRPPAGFVIYKFGSRSIVGGFKSSSGEVWVLKYYYPRSFYKRATYGLRGTRCMHSWKAALALRYAGIPTPEALLIAEWKSGGGLWWNRSFLATKQAAGITLDEWVREHASDGARLNQIAGRLAEIFERMNRCRIAHGDLKATNILVDENDAISFVDLDGASILTPLSKWPAARARDRRIFENNWKGHAPFVGEAFARVFLSKSA